MSERLRLDKWLWHARFCKTRSVAAAAIDAGGVRINGRPAVKSHQAIAVGDTLTLPIGPKIVVLKVLGLGKRRGPVCEARTLYEELTCGDSPRP